MKNEALLWAASVVSLRVAAMLTLLKWPLTDPIKCQPLSSVAWWQFEWLEGLGFLLSAMPSFVIYELDFFFAAHPQLRQPIALR